MSAGAAVLSVQQLPVPTSPGEHRRGCLVTCSAFPGPAWLILGLLIYTALNQPGWQTV